MIISIFIPQINCVVNLGQPSRRSFPLPEMKMEYDMKVLFEGRFFTMDNFNSATSYPLPEIKTVRFYVLAKKLFG